LRVIVFEDTGFIFPVTIPWQQTSVLCILAVFVATVAGLVPALHAARLRIAEAIQYE
jgi:ABC-type lipoprotein release transport system permease subunit